MRFHLVVILKIQLLTSMVKVNKSKTVPLHTVTVKRVISHNLIMATSSRAWQFSGACGNGGLAIREACDEVSPVLFHMHIYSECQNAQLRRF